MFSMVLALTDASVSQQLNPAERGMLQCQMPDIASKTCFSLSRVRRTSPSTYAFDTEILIDAAGTITASIHSKVFVRGATICEVMNRTDVSGATFASEGSRLSPAQAADYRARLLASYAPVLGHTICTQILPGEDGVDTVIGSIDGRRIPSTDYAMKWVDPGDGWKVGP